MSVRHPRIFVQFGGATIPLLSLRTMRSAERSADRFEVTLSATKAAQYGLTLNDFADWQPTDVQVLITMDRSEPQTVMSGRVDCPEIDWQTLTIRLDGRDKSALLIDKRRSEKFQNQKTKDVVEKIAKDHKLTAHVESSAGFAGKVQTQDNAYLALNRTDFDILTDLAEREGCRWYVDGDNLYFEPRDADSGTFGGYYYPPGNRAAHAVSNLLRLQTRRNMTAARPHKVRGRSWHHREAREYEYEAEMGGVGEPIEFEHHHNGKKQNDLQGLMEGRLKNHARHDLQISVQMPLDLSVTPRQRFSLTGTGTIYDQLYDIDTVEIEVGWDHGADMRLECKSAKNGRATGRGSSSGGAGAGKTGTPETQGPQQPRTVPLPPARPSGLGGGDGGVSL